ncbi:MAG: hypothetical protein ABI068_03460 [Ktedonobacterales bacterium]
METVPTAPSAYPGVSPALTLPLPAPQSQRGQRMWPVLLTLYFLSPLIAEVLSGSTPPLLFIQPFGFIFTPLLYGSSAILIREIVVRRRLGWGNVLLLGAGFGIFQEALVVQTWYNFVAKSSPSHSNGSYGVLLGTNWVWALNLTIYHAVISIAIPLLLLHVLFPQRARLPALRRRGVLLLLLWLMLPCGLLALNVAKAQFAKEGYAGPPLVGYLIGCALLVATLLLGSFVHFSPPRLQPGKRAPGVWSVRLAMFGLTTLFFALDMILPATKLPPPVTMALAVAVFAFGLWRIGAWSARDGWNARHRLAVVMGLLGWYLLLWGPLVEFGIRLPLREGLTLANLLVMIALFLFDWRLKHRSTAPTPTVSSLTQTNAPGIA